jgi:hypothetical protein
MLFSLAPERVEQGTEDPLEDPLERFTVRRDDLGSESVDDELLVIDFVTNHYYCLNPTASTIWSTLDVVPSSIDELAEWTGATYSRPADEVRRDVAELVTALVDEGLLVTSQATADAPAAPPGTGGDYVVPRFEKFGTLDQLMLAGE